ncbi:hypothetical protein GCM10011504_49260 [Siccirubricoccus deserti]|uniref:Uncharacterized protein n=1 Tax=Siccirubricoccus deserti TaxID=2013562 RepID=A0A9X0R4I5_9PROT|nr:hypothetical protein [Siccirubricoccus deserti]MBC4018412.1 hypothetical protein [Siccirubricoccus deserti]GGC65393.1 hypothetical protein GCM10011504_49260 [Siccirubricoccus deserti]
MSRATAVDDRAGEGAADRLVPVHTDWLYHHLRVTGDPGEVTAFRTAAAGAGVIPWQHDLGPAAEDWFHLLVAPPAPQRRSLSLEGARILASQLQEAAEARQRLAVERAAASRACPLDLHRLLPVPERLLHLGPEHPEALAWLWAHWGTTQALRQVVELPVPVPGRPRPIDPGLLWLGFWAADWTPWQAILALRTRWPGLRIEVRPLYDDP